MRPRKDTIPMSEWSVVQLNAVLKSKKSNAKLKTKVEQIFQHRKEKGKIFLNNFFNQDKNKFWNLALWQLYREGKTKQYGVGEHKRFYIDDVSLVIDKMIEIRRKISNFEVVKSDDTITKELHTWKR